MIAGNPRCTVILPTRNRAATLPRAVASVTAQNEPDFELIVIDEAKQGQVSRPPSPLPVIQ